MVRKVFLKDTPKLQYNMQKPRVDGLISILWLFTENNSLNTIQSSTLTIHPLWKVFDSAKFKPLSGHLVF